MSNKEFLESVVARLTELENDLKHLGSRLTKTQSTARACVTKTATLRGEIVRRLADEV